MAFDSGSGMLSCQSCGREDNIATFSDEYKQMSFSEDEAKEYQCENCGAVVITEADTTATSCSFCGAGVVLGDRLSGALAPKQVIPFKISKEEAREAFKKWCKNGLLTPKGFMDGNRIKEMTGMYVPFWLYDINSKAQVNATGKKVRKYTRGDYIYTETKHYDIYRDVNLTYANVPADASEKMSDTLMDKLEPYHYAELKEFKTPYLAGYLAEKYNYDDKQLFPRIKERVSDFVDDYVQSTISGYSSVSYSGKSISSRQEKADYVLFPVWMVYYDFDKQQHTFAMNGQTGKVVGKPPLSMQKIAAWFGGIAGGTFVLMKIVAVLMGGGLW